jgi:hypothetical protein
MYRWVVREFDRMRARSSPEFLENPRKSTQIFLNSVRILVSPFARTGAHSRTTPPPSPLAACDEHPIKFIRASIVPINAEGMRALSIRQPFAEMILRGIKRIEYRSRPTRIIGERFWIYAAKGSGVRSTRRVVGDNIAVPDKPLQPWMIELAEALRLWKPGELPTGVIVGSAVVERCSGPHAPTSIDDRPYFQWHLTGVQRLAELCKPSRHPQPAWFNPF